MQLMIASAAFDSHGAGAQRAAAAACSAAAAQGADLLLLPGLRWDRKDISRLSRAHPEMVLCAALGDHDARKGSLLVQNGETLLVQPALYGPCAEGRDVALADVQGFKVAILADEDAAQPPAMRMAALRGATLVLCPIGNDAAHKQLIWAQVQQNGLYAALAPTQGTARILAPLCAAYPSGTMARGRSGTMAIAGLSLLQWARSKLVHDPLSALNRAFAASIPAPPDMHEMPAAPFNVAVVQRQLDFQGGKKALLARMESLCAQAVKQHCRLIAFPEYNWLDAIAPLPFIARALTKGPHPKPLLDPQDEREIAARFPDSPDAIPPLYIAALMRLRKGALRRLATREASRLARRYDLVVHAGTVWETKKKKTYSTAIIAYPDGSFATQRKLCPSRSERAMGLSPGDELIAFPVGDALCVSPIGLDGHHYEPFAAARRIGCTMAIMPSFAQGAFHADAETSGAWARAHESCLYVLKPALTGHMLGHVFTGKAGIYGPPCQPLALSKSPFGEALLVAQLDFAALRQACLARTAPNAQLEQNLAALLRGEA